MKVKRLKRGKRDSNAGSHPDRIVRILSPYWMLWDSDLRFCVFNQAEVQFFARIEDALKAKGRSERKQIHGPYRIELLESGGMRMIDLQSWKPQ